MLLHNSDWFIIQHGENRGRWHLSGWNNVPDRLAECPRCHACVLSGSRWVHEDWHHLTDHPHPETADGKH